MLKVSTGRFDEVPVWTLTGLFSSRTDRYGAKQLLETQHHLHFRYFQDVGISHNSFLKKQHARCRCLAPPGRSDFRPELELSSVLRFTRHTSAHFLAIHIWNITAFRARFRMKGVGLAGSCSPC
ncbi:hypothetical protein Q8A67_015059 [Cirrhinus molitorella]|uniref:Uncharacterized protein n=1 Tax=Cirrhinus molitorella TaxID=172907 RepID=A0AA88PPP2_9TELE|nr:hypothetical protein Q8A67_015059 [Cirrhinus molitorella]